MIWRLFREIENEDVDEDTNKDEISPSMEEGAPLPHVTYLERFVLCFRGCLSGGHVGQGETGYNLGFRGLERILTQFEGQLNTQLTLFLSLSVSGNGGSCRSEKRTGGELANG